MLYIYRKLKLSVDNKTNIHLKRDNSLEESEELRLNNQRIQILGYLLRRIEKAYIMIHRSLEDHVNNNVP